MSLEKKELEQYSKGLINRLFSILDYTNKATSEKDLDNIIKYISGLELEIKGSLAYYSDYKFGNKMTSVLMKVSGTKETSDYNVRRKAVLDSIGIINEILNSIE
jgi:hypothetical protein